MDWKNEADGLTTRTPYDNNLADGVGLDCAVGIAVSKPGGHIYYKPQKVAAFGNLLVQSVNATTVEVGTDKYVMMQTRKVFTKELTKQWESMRNRAIRLAVDVDSAREFFDEAQNTLYTNELVRMLWGLVNNASGFHLSIDLDSQDLLALVATGIDEEGSAQLQTGMDAVLVFLLAKLRVKQSVVRMAKETPELSKVAAEIVDNLRTSKPNHDVRLVVFKPERFNEALAIALRQAKGTGDKMGDINNC